MTLLLECGAAFGTTMAAAHGFILIGSHIRPVIFSSHGVIHTVVFRLVRKRRML